MKQQTPYMILHGKEASLHHLRVIGARAFVRVETHTKKAVAKACEEWLVGYSGNNKSFCIYSPAKRRVLESRNIIFIETPPISPDLGLGADLCDDFTGDFTYEKPEAVLRDIRH